MGRLWIARFVSLTLVVLVTLVPAEVATAKPTAPPAEARPAPPEPTPYHELVRGLNARLRAEAPASFAGTARSIDGGIDLYLTGADASVKNIVQELQSTVGQGVNVHLIAGVKHSLATLEGLRDELRARRQALSARGITLVEFGVHVTANRVRVGVKALDANKLAYLNEQFGAERILAFQGGEWQATTRGNDSPPWWGGIKLDHATGGSCTAGYSIVLPPQNTTAVTTAGHCGWDNWFNGPSANLVGSTSSLQYADGQSGDAQMIATSGGAGGYVYVSEFSALPVRSYVQVEQMGEFVCSDGFATDERCGSNYIEFVNQCISYTTGFVICGMTLAYNSSFSPATAPGDSGGPVYHRYADGVSIRGLIGANQTTDPHRWAYTPAWLLINMWQAYPMLAN